MVLILPVEVTAMIPLKTSRNLKASILLVVFAAGLLTGCSTLRDESIVSGKRRAIPEAELTERLVAIQAKPTVSQSKNGFESERLWGPYNDWEPAIAIDPATGNVYQLTTRYDGPEACKRCSGPYIIFRRSIDGGATWEADQCLTPFRKSHNDPQIEVASTGTIYVAWLNDYVPGVKFIKSADQGSTWTAPITITTKSTKPNWSDKPVLAVSADGRDVYIAFNASDSFVTGSHDYGATFFQPIRTSNDKRYWFHTGGAVAPDGSVYFAVTDYSLDYTGDAHINVLKSSDRGATWMSTRVDTSKEAPRCDWSPGCYLGFFGPSAVLAADADGTIMLAYNAGDIPGAPQRMWVRTSTDGVTWSGRTEISNGSPAVNNAFPALAAGPKPGDFRLAWQDDRNGSTTAWNTWYRRTTGGGNSWTEAVRVSDQAGGAPYKTSAGYAFPYGDFFEIAVDAEGRSHLIWGEGANYSGFGGTWYTREFDNR
jgi:hypothetical protein